jgi:uncharacterized protein YutE (UPF0331/DUF86 family)/predicted nucleotidyltransferase
LVGFQVVRHFPKSGFRNPHSVEMPTKLQLLPPDIRSRLKALPDCVSGIAGLTALWLFGSFARGEATPISDVDLAYVPDEELTGDVLERFETDLYRTIASILHTDEFAFVNLRGAPAYFSWQALQEGHLLFCRDPLAVARLAEAIYQRAPDARWLRHRGNTDFLEALGMPEPKKVDRDRVIEFLRLLGEDTRILREKAQVPKALYVGSRDLQAIVERRLQTATESCINTSSHLIARLSLRPPSDYADVFQALGEAQILPWELAQQMMDMARFRNLLVHVYWAIDHERVHATLKTRLMVLEAFAHHIAEWLQEQQKEETDRAEGTE